MDPHLKFQRPGLETGVLVRERGGAGSGFWGLSPKPVGSDTIAN